MTCKDCIHFDICYPKVYKDCRCQMFKSVLPYMQQKVGDEMYCKNKEIWVQGFRYDDARGEVTRQNFECIITNDSVGKTLSNSDGKVQYTLSFKPLEKYLK